METIHDFLASNARLKSDKQAFTFIEDNGEQEQVNFGELHHRAQCIAQTLSSEVEPGSRVVLLYPPGLEYIQAFLGCLYAGVVAVPLYPPQSKKHAGRVLTVIDDCQASLVLTNAALKQQLEVELSPLPVQGFEDLIVSGSTNEMPLPKADQIAFLQYTSGSTGTPKGVMITHGNIVANLKTLQQATGCAEEDVFCNWLPLFHDLGLVNTLLLPIFLGAHSVLMSPVRFIKSPLAWFKAITEFKATICGAPNFAFDHCLERIKPHNLAGINLSTWRIAFNAAEPVDADTLMRFCDRYARVGFKESAIFPAYGMAEATVFICGGIHTAPYTANPFDSGELQNGMAQIQEDSAKQQILVGHGHVQAEHQLKIVSPETLKELKDGEVGEIWFAGPSLAQGYWNDEEKSQASFGFKLENDEHRYLRTGDLGFIHNGELYISGRIKDVLIIKGRNYYPQDFEKLAYNVFPGLSQNGAAAFEVNGNAVLLLEVSRNEMKSFDYELASETIKTAVFEQFEVVLEDILFLKVGRISRTSSGKIQRSLMKKRYQANDIECLYKASKGKAQNNQQVDETATPISELEAQLCALWQEVFGLESIGVDDNFLSLGGHSLLASQLVAQIQKTWQVDVSIRDFFTANTIRKLAKIIESASVSQLPAIQPVAETTLLLPSFAQERMWFVDQIESEPAQNNLSFSLKFYGELNIAYLERAFTTIISRHQALRTTFNESEGQVYQKVQDTFAFNISIVDLTDLTRDKQESNVEKLSREEASKAFNLAKDLMLRATLLKLNAQSHILLLTVHHIAADGWSLGVLTKELNALYAAQIHNRDNPLTPLDIQYSDYAHWQRNWLNGAVLENHLAYWKAHLSDLPVVHGLPLDHPRPLVQSFKGASVHHTLDSELVESLYNLARGNQATLFMLLNAAFACLLSRYSGETDIVIGSPIANREQAEVAPLIGVFINNLVFRSDLSGDPRFIDLLEQSKERTFSAYEHQQLPFEKLVDELQPERNLSHSPLFQVMLILQNQEMEALNLPGLEVKQLQPTTSYAQYDLTLTIQEDDNGLKMDWQYAADIFDLTTIEGMVKHFDVMLRGIVQSPTTQVSHLPLLAQEESSQILNAWNDTATEFPQDKCIHELFELQVQATPKAIAAVFESESLTYEQLNQRANQLARYLIQQGVKTDSVVGICIERSLDMLVGTLAIMKAGGAYLPMDPGYPKARLEHMIEDSGVQWVISHKQVAEQLKLKNSICLDDERLSAELMQQENTNVAKESLGLTSNNLAYLIYTSGSTGKPKGVMLEHLNVVNFLTSMQATPGLTDKDTLLAVTSLSFDIHVLELYLPLAVGGKVIIASSEAVLSPDHLSTLMAEHHVTAMQATPSTWKMLVNNDWQPRSELKALCGGEALNDDLKQALLARESLELWNMYGPTETAVWSATRKIEKEISLGRPIANTQFYVLDNHLNPVPVGVAGELYIGGKGVARGYFNRPELTAERFILSPFSETRLYKTGDLVRWLPDGTLEYLRRVDLQVKVRGHRIELEEVETALKQHADVIDAVAQVFTEDGVSSLVAYVTSNAADIESGLKQKMTEHLEGFLPVYMVPTSFMVLEQIPLTPNGKINRNALPKPQIVLEAEYVAPTTETEKQLCHMWQTLLKLEVEQGQFISVNSNFFDLGGHSLLAARLVALIRQEWQVEVPIKALFSAQSVRKLASVIDQTSCSQVAEILPAATDKPIPLSFAQQRLWLIEQIEGGTNQYNMCQAFRLSGKLDIAAMTAAFEAIVERHLVLRTRIQTTDSGEGMQVVSNDWDFAVPYLDLSGLAEDEREPAIFQHIAEESSQPFDLSRDLMMRVKLLKLADEVHVLLVTMHHIAVDGWSVSIIFDEFNRLYRSPEQQLPEISVQYGDYAQWQKAQLQGEVLNQHLTFWKNRLKNLPEVHNLATDRPRPPVQNYAGSHHLQTISAEVQKGIYKLARATDTTPFMVLQTALAILLSRHSDKGENAAESENIIIGSPVANREQAELAPLVGFFTNSVVLQTDLSDNPCFSDLLQRSKEVLLDVYEHAHLPFEKLVDELKQERNLGYSPLFQVKLALQNNEQGWFDLPGIVAEKIEQSHSVALHDLSVDIYELDKDGEADGLKLDWEYATALFNAATIERMSAHFEVLLKGIIETPNAKVSELPFLSSKEVEQLLTWSKWPSQDSNKQDVSVLELFEEQVAKNPDNIAVVIQQSAQHSEKISYQELNAKANQLANYLVNEGVKPDTLVGLCVERSLEMMIGIWGILKAGAAYVPIDPDYPEKHIEHILDDSGIEIMLTSSELLSELPFDDLQILPLDDEMWDSFLGDYDEENLDRQQLGLTLNNLAYVIYTSGSTGLPKGVTVEHKALAQSTLSRFEVYQESPQSFALFSSFAFDSSIVGIFWTLVSGGKLCIVDTSRGIDLQAFQVLLTEEKISHFLTLPSVYQTMLMADLQPGEAIKTVIVAGEVCDQNLVKQHQSSDHWRNSRLFNEYGPTEACVWSSFYDCTHHAGGSIPIGTTVPHAELYVLDNRLQLCAPGVVGELYIGGENLARGYHNAPALTKEKFIESPFQQGQRLYKTGDLVRCLPEKDGKPGYLEFIGRLDHQIKIRGFRVELGEIEAAIVASDLVSEAVVLAKSLDPAQEAQHLVAYVVANETNCEVFSNEKGLDESAFREALNTALASKLLSHKIPSVFVLLDKLPQTPNGKVDRAALQEKAVPTQLTQKYVAPRTDIEKQLSEIWQNLLKRKKVGITENFFSIGGDSILAIQAVTLAGKEGLMLTTRQIFESQTIEKLAPLVNSESKVVAPQQSISGEQILIPIQKAFLSTDLVDLDHYNQSVLLTLPENFSIDALQRIVSAIYERHDVLRLSVSDDKATYIPYSETLAERAVRRIDLGHLDGEAWEAELAKLGTEIKAGLSLADGDVFRAVLFDGKVERRRLLLTMHHMVVDGVSWRILLQDMASAFALWQQGTTITLAPKTSSFQQWGEYLLEYANSDNLQPEKDFWLAQCQEPVDALPVDHEGISDNSIAASKTLTFQLRETETQALLNVCNAAYRTGVNDLLLSALYLALHKWTGGNTFRIDLESHGREALTNTLDLTQTMGWFTSVFPVTLASASVASLGDVIKSLKEQLRKVPNNGIGFGLLQQMLKDSAQNQVFRQATGVAPILFNYLGQFDQVVNSDGPFQEAVEFAGDDVSSARQRGHMIELNGMVTGGKLSFSLRFNALQYQQETMASLVQGIESSLYEIIEHCQGDSVGGVTPSDFPLSQVSQVRLDDWYQVWPDMEKLYITTGMQQGLLFHSSLDVSAYLTQLSVNIEGSLDAVAMQQAWQAVVSRHDVFRTVFVDDHSHQIVLSDVALPFMHLDWSEFSESEKDDKLTQFLREDRASGFDLTQVPLMRVTLITFSEMRHSLVWSNHHALSDGWSLPLVLKEVMSFYKIAHSNADTTSLASELPAPPAYENYIAWLQQQDEDKAREFWADTLASVESPTHIHLEHSVENETTGPGKQTLSLTPTMSQQLQSLARQHQVTLNTLVQAAWAYTIHQYSGEQQVVFGETVSGRPPELKDVEHIVGLFINSLPVVVNIDPAQPIGSWLRELHQASIGRVENGFLALSEIQNLSPVSQIGGKGRTLFDTLVIFENYPVDQEIQKIVADSDLTVTGIKNEEYTNYALTLMVLPENTDLNGKLSFELGYRREQFNSNSIARLLGQFELILSTFLEQSTQRVGELSVLGSDDEKQLIEWNRTTAEYPEDKCIHELFEQQVALNPNAVAAVFEQEQFTYAQLNERANQLAHYLVAQGIKPDSVVGVCITRSMDMLVATLAIMKAGGAYLPMDPGYPKSRLDYMVENSGVKWVITSKNMAELLTVEQTICLDDADFAQQLSLLQSSNLAKADLALTSANLAYLIYTSGSTGKPKGVMLEHRNAVNFLFSMEKLPGLTSEDTLLAVTSLSFDIHVLELYLPLCVGGAVVIASNEATTSPDDLAALLQEHQVTAMQATPATWKMLLSNHWKPQQKLKALCGGEAIGEDLKDALIALEGIELWNMYGPTETAVWSATHRIENKISLGAPIANTQFYVLDSQLNQVPIGVAGELYIGGAGVARGYFNKPELTAERFMQDPFSASPDARLYKTGDLVCWLPDGTLEYISRIDQQVKIRGFRIELGEIESRLNLHPEIKESVVVAQGKTGNKQLIAFYLGKDAEVALDHTELKALLQQALPEYMLPTTFVRLDSIPLTPNGKVDRLALENLDVNLESKQAYVAPRNDTEQRLVDIWAEVLNLEPEKIGVKDSFFELGGHSLLATQVIVKIRSQFEINLHLKSLFEQDCIAQLAGLILEAEKSKFPKILPVNRTELAKQGQNSLPLSFVQERLWFIEQLDPNSANYNNPGAVTIKSHASRPLNVDWVEQALNIIIARHENLRTLFPSVEGNVQQVILAHLDFKLETVDLSGVQNQEARNQEAQAICQLEASTPFDLGQGPLIRGKLIKLSENEHIFMLNMHHIISDNWSMAIIIKEFRLIMEAFEKGDTPILPTLPIQYVDYSVWQRQFMEESGLLQNQMDYWQNKLAGVEESLNLATDYPRRTTPTFDGATEVFSLDSELANSLKRLTEKQGCTLYMTLQAAFKSLFYRYTGQEDICFGGSIANRQNEETEGLIGMFANTLVFRDLVEGEDSFTTLLAQVKNTCLEAYQHQDTPFEKIVELVQPERTVGISPLFQVMFVLHNVPMDLSENDIQDYPLEINSSRFDLIIHFTETANGLDGMIVYKTALFKQQTIERMVKHFIALCNSIVAKPETKICDLDFLGEHEKHKLLVEFNDNPLDYPKEKCIHQLFVEQVASNPEKIAVVEALPSGSVGADDSRLLTFRQLHDQSRSVALYLQSQGVKPDSLVGLCVERSTAMMIGMLGILQAGGAYVPLDPDYPEDRLGFMLQDSQANIVITQKCFQEKVRALVKTGVQVIVLDEQGNLPTECLAEVNRENMVLREDVRPDNLAYVIYTSGSTGQPKGVMIEHRMVVDYCYSVVEKMDLQQCDTFAAVSSFSSDLGNIALYVPIMFSKTLYVFSNQFVNNPIALHRFMDKHPIDCMKITPSHFEMFKVSDEEIVTVSKALIFAGEPLTKSTVDMVNKLNPDCKVFNNYGPTETTISKLSSSALTSSNTHNLTSIYLGKPLHNTQVIILDPKGNLVPVGTPGELHIAGNGVARGYLNRPDLTYEKFIPNPYQPGTLMYKTGDLGRWLDDGNIEFLGRIDTQVKIRGFRIETSEIEDVLNRHPSINNSVVVAQSQESDTGAVNKQLIAFYIANAADLTIDSDELKEHLLQTLPDYMLPVAFVELEEIPLTGNGKVDRRRLEQMNVSLESGQVYLAPRNDMERQLVGIWAEILGLEPEQIGINDSFFELGGHSLLAVLLVSKISKQLDLDLPLHALFDLKTISGIAEILIASTTLNQQDEFNEEDDSTEHDFVEGTL
ncbi:non-ribosomal peptide synthase/polyketide synthase [Paraneptunicella aestuarii]|uniref:non-ribosomal peptide synthase/polyketide synthase n=1 Tax=Paraneptunicella aestuarii TaxID=2831148 RepID=UPI001E445AC3|nr:non-ribosomal peptide synthase/polyketide synthase [Paraneptunicella aestuarii]UAA39457.1 non-ribosomal peptide synthase/polyketide synthase [Paraneptunicella aestuarii]